jgi:hypothetical protein
MIDVKMEKVGSCVLMVLAKADMADLPTHNLGRLAKAYSSQGQASVRWELCCMGPAKYTSDTTDIGYDEMPRLLSRLVRGVT